MTFSYETKLFFFCCSEFSVLTYKSNFHQLLLIIVCTYWSLCLKHCIPMASSFPSFRSQPKGGPLPAPVRSSLTSPPNEPLCLPSWSHIIASACFISVLAFTLFVHHFSYCLSPLNVVKVPWRLGIICHKVHYNITHTQSVVQDTAGPCGSPLPGWPSVVSSFWSPIPSHTE